MDFILNHVALGDEQDALNHPPVDALLCVAEECRPPAGFAHVHQVPMIDMRPIPAQQLDEAISWIAGLGGQTRVLVYCRGGIGRSSSVVVAYLCCALQYGFGEAVEFVACRRPYMSLLPNLLVSVNQAREWWYARYNPTEES